MQRRIRITLWIAGIAVVLVGGLALLAGSTLIEGRGFALYETPIQVLGEVVDERTGEPLSGATVYVLGGGNRVEAEKDLEELLEHATKYPDESGNYGPFGAHVLTDANGRFNLTLWLTYCSAFGPGIEREYPPEYYGARMILVQKEEGYERTFFSTATGTWRVLEQRNIGDAYAVVDAKTLRLPPAE